METNRIAFIICTNNELLLSECLLYINQLFIPDGYIIDIITIKDATSMTAGYNKGMTSSTAKYKVYMHQDVFIINRYFLIDMLNIFNSDEKIGMLGLVGYPRLSQTGSMWHEKRVGTDKLFGTNRDYPNSHYSLQNIIQYSYDILSDSYQDVAIIDGLMMITSKDLEWNEVLLKDWDFYDAFQSMNFLEHGYRIVVPNQKVSWVIHDDGALLSMWNYNKYRHIFMEKYNRYLGLTAEEIRALAK